jgi:hypothetical protein
MKKLFTISSAVLLSAGMIWMAGCKKDDTTPPTVSLKGANPMTLSIGSTTGDPGATANDDKDGDISTKITSDWSTKVNASMKGSYTVTYSVSDAAGNTGTATRTVNVVNDADAFAGNYLNCSETCSVTPASSFTAAVTASNSVNGQVAIANFGAFGASISVTATITPSTGAVTVATSQSLGGSAYIQNVYTPPTAVVSSTAPTKFEVKYQWNDGTSSDVCDDMYIR